MDKVFDEAHVGNLINNYDYDALFNYCQIFAAGDDPKAMYELAECYYYGHGTEVDYEKSLYYLNKAASSGLSYAQHKLASWYSQGIVVEENEVEAVKWYMKAAEQGNAYAQYCLAYCYDNGEGVEQNIDKAVEWYIKSAEHGEDSAQYYLARMYYEGRGVEQNNAKAVEWYIKAAEQGLLVDPVFEEMAAKQGDIEAQYRLAYYLYLHDEEEQHYAKAVQWFTVAAEQGHSKAQYFLALCYHIGDGVEQNNAKAAEWFLKAAEQGERDAQFKLAFLYNIGEGVEQNKTKAAEWFLKAAEQGDYEAQYNLAVCYYNGEGVEQNKAKAVGWFTKAAESVVEAQYNLAVCYYNGEGVEQNKAKAVEWFTEAAEHGEADAQFKLAVCYYEGYEVEQNKTKAAELFTKAAEQGCANAQLDLGFCYENGCGVQLNYDIATEWYTKSAEQGIAKAKKALNRIKRKKWINKIFSSRKTASWYNNVIKEKEDTISRLAAKIIELEQANIEIKSDLIKRESEFQTMLDMQREILNVAKENGRKLDELIDFIKKSLPEKLEMERTILSLKLDSIHSTIEQNEEAVAEWNRKMDEYICNNIKKCGNANEIADATYDLSIKFGDVWYKLDEEVRTSLASSRVMWLKCREYKGGFDFSGICITATAALESLLTKVFLKNFQEYLQNNEIPKPDWPVTLVYNDHGTLKPNKFFTLGNLKYLLGDSDEWSDGKKWTKNRKTNLENYLNSIINKNEEYKDPRDVFIKKGYNEKPFLERCEEIRKKYRNEAAHTNCVDKQTAEQCYDDIIGVSEHLEKVNNIIWILFDILKSN